MTHDTTTQPADQLSEIEAISAIITKATMPSPEQISAIATAGMRDAALIYPDYPLDAEVSSEEYAAAVTGTPVAVAHKTIALATPEFDAVIYYRDGDGSARQAVVPHDVIVDLLADLAAEQDSPSIFSFSHWPADGTAPITGLFISTANHLVELFDTPITIGAETIILSPNHIDPVLIDGDIVQSIIDNSLVTFTEGPWGTHIAGFNLLEQIPAPLEFALDAGEADGETLSSDHVPEDEERAI